MSQVSIDRLARFVKWGIFLLPLSALIVGGSFWGKVLFPFGGDLFFPFITGKNIFFRIITEILLGLWVFLAFFDKRYRPKFTPVFWAILATVFVLTLSTIFGANPYRSFWSNYERMEGLVGHLHLFAYFLVLTNSFLKYEDWKKLFFVSLGVSFIVSSYAYFQSLGFIRVFQSSERVDATLGNSTYLAIYIVFHLFLALYFLLKENRGWLKYSLFSLIIYEVPIVFLTATRGAILGLLGGGFLLALFYGFWSKNSKFKKISLGFIGLSLVMIVSFWFLKDKNFVQENYVLKRFANMSFKEQTIQSRFLIWSISGEGFKEKPILGWGIENYDQVFNKYFKPELWSNEPWFDRSHNIIFDWLIHAGILGFMAYASIFITVFYMLQRSFARNEVVVFSILFLIYIFHNLFVFDNLTSYFLFFSILGFINFRYRYRESEISAYRNVDISKYKVIPNQLHFIVPPLVFVAMIFSLYFINLKSLWASNALIGTMKNFSTRGGDTDFMISNFDKVFSYRTFGSGEAREQLVQYTNAVLASEGISEQDKIKVVEKAIFELKKQIEDNPNSARIHVMLGNVYGSVGLFDDAQKTLKRALELSPKKQQIHFLIADIYLRKNELDKAFEIIKTTYELDPSYKEAAKNLVLISIISGKQDFAEELLQKTYGKTVIGDEQLVNAYGRVGNWKKVKDIWELLVKEDDDNVQYRVSLAAAHLKLGERNKAIEVIREAMAISMDFRPQGEAIIKEIQSGKSF
ncbi:MAG: O-antigen ligase family protein [Patescibacteria group bacterium]